MQFFKGELRLLNLTSTLNLPPCAVTKTPKTSLTTATKNEIRIPDYD